MRAFISNKDNLPTVLTSILIIFYLVGTVGISLYPSEFSKLTPLNLLLTLLLMLWMHPDKGLFLYVNLAFIFIASFTLEFVGVNTGLIFGPYSYKESLGIKLGETPLLIGVNWIIVVYSSVHLVQTASKKLKITLKPIPAALIAGSLMLLLDILIEPVAPTLDFWAFENLIVPIQNYTAWFFFGFMFCYWLIKSGLTTNNPMGWRVYAAQFIFFSILNFSL
jgi:putative membrane protein